VVNNALLALAFGPEERAWQFNPVGYTDRTALEAHREQFLWCIREAAEPVAAQRVWTDAADAYLHMREEFNADEQQAIEGFLRDRARTYGEAAERRGGPLYAPAALAAVVAHVLTESRGGVDYGEDIAWLESYAEECGLSLGDSYGPTENSSYAVPYVYLAMLRLSVWNHGRMGVMPEAHRQNLRKAVTWLLDVYPHSGLAVTFGSEWSAAHTTRLVDFLHAAAYYLNQGSGHDIEVARYAKWLATEMFRYGIRYTCKDYPLAAEPAARPTRREIGAPRMAECNPMWIWRYCDDNVRMSRPHPGRYGSKAVRAEHGDTVSEGPPQEVYSKVVHRSGWDPESLYLLVDLAPRTANTAPYANALCDISYDGASFTPGHRHEAEAAGGQTAWSERITVEPDDSERLNGELKWMYDTGRCSLSRTDSGKWRRLITLAKHAPYAVVMDFTQAKGVAHWQFVSDGDPQWHDDWVELNRGDARLRFFFPNEQQWYEVKRWDDSRAEEDVPKRVWAVDDPARCVALGGTMAWAVAVAPVVPGGVVFAEAIAPQRGDQPGYPLAVGLRVVSPEFADVHGARRARGVHTYADFRTDAECFYLHQTRTHWHIMVVNATTMSLALKQPVHSVQWENRPARGWTFEHGTLTYTLPHPATGTLEVR
jgi:hypothetical protein